MKVKVTKIPGTYAVDGTNYGPFTASAEEPHTEVPEGLALALSLPVFDGELFPAQDEIQPEGAGIQELLDANHSLKEDLDALTGAHQIVVNELAKVQAMLDSTHVGAAQLGAALNGMRTRADGLQAELESTQSDFIRYQNDLPGLRARVAELEAGAAAADLADAVQNNTQAIKETTFANTTVVTSSATPAPAEPVTTEPDKASKAAKPAKGGAK